MIERLKKEIALLNEQKEAVLRVDNALKPFNGKVMNKKVTDAVQSIERLKDSEGYEYSPYGASYVKDGQKHNLSIHKFIQRRCVDLVHIYNAELMGIVVNNRFNYNKLHEIIQDKVDSLNKEIQNITEDIKTGEQRLEEYNQEVEKLNQLYMGFSRTFRDNLNYKFNRVLK